MSLLNSHNGYIGNGIIASAVHTDALDLGYATVQQLTNFTTGVTINATSGQIVLDTAATIAPGGEAEFLVTNNRVRRNSMIFTQFESDVTSAFVTIQVKNTTAGSFTIQVATAVGLAAGNYSLNFAILHVD